MRRHLVTRRVATPAPDFTSDKPYPSGGVKISVAWQAAWDDLHHADELAGGDLADLMCAVATIRRDTALTLLREACAAGWLRARFSGRLRRERAWFSLTHAARCYDAGQLDPAALSTPQAAGGSLPPAGRLENAPGDAPGTRNRHGSSDG